MKYSLSSIYKTYFLKRRMGKVTKKNDLVRMCQIIIYYRILFLQYLFLYSNLKLLTCKFNYFYKVKVVNPDNLAEKIISFFNSISTTTTSLFFWTTSNLNFPSAFFKKL